VTIAFVPPRLAKLAEHAGAYLCLFALEERHPLAGVTGALDWRLHGHLSRLLIGGFLTGAAGERLLVPLGDRLPLEHLVVIGLGPRDELTGDRCAEVLRQMFVAATDLGGAPLVMALPGRPEQLVEPAEAMARFLAAYDAHGDGREVAIVEPSAAQKAMLPVLERHRLRQGMPTAE
jgi:hypothetical protein